MPLMTRLFLLLKRLNISSGGRVAPAQEVLKILPENLKPINIEQLFNEIPVLGRIHEEKMAA